MTFSFKYGILNIENLFYFRFCSPELPWIPYSNSGLNLPLLVTSPHTISKFILRYFLILSFYLKSSSVLYNVVISLLCQNCTVDPSEEITKRVEELAQVFSQKFAQAVGQRCEELGRKVKPTNDFLKACNIKIKNTNSLARLLDFFTVSK